MLNYTSLTPAVERAAKLAHSKFPDHHDLSDVKQTLWVWILENKTTVGDLVRKSEGSDHLLVNLMVKAASSHLKKEDAAAYGYDEEDAFTYSADVIKSILEVIFRYEDWQSFAMSQDTQPRAKKNPAHGNDNLASYADVKSAVEKLPEGQYNTVVWRYKYQYTFAQIGAENGTSKQAAEDSHRSALNNLQRYLGKENLADFRRGYDGRQEPRGNASANAQTERDYEG